MITINIDKAKEITHTSRRASRNEAFKPLDIKATIPSEAVQAEKDRAVIRELDNNLQLAIDNSTTVEHLKALMQ